MTRQKLETYILQLKDMNTNKIIEEAEYNKIVQRVSAKILETMKSTLEEYKYLKPLSTSPSEKDIEELDKWIENQILLKKKKESLAERARKISLEVIFSQPYFEEELEKQERFIEEKEAYLSRCNNILTRWKKLQVTDRAFNIHTPVETLNEEERYLENQEILYNRYKRLKNQYSNADIPSKDLKFPVQNNDIDYFEKEFEFSHKWNQKILSEKKQILPWYVSKVNFPKAPYTSAEIVAYRNEIRPYLLRTKKYKYLFILALIVLIDFCGYALYDSLEQQSLRERVEKIIERGKEYELPYPEGRLSEEIVQRFEKQIQEQEILKQRIEKFQKSIPDDLDMCVPVPNGRLTDATVQQFERKMENLLKEIELGVQVSKIPAGTFMMGCSKNKHCETDEKNQHEVTLSDGFYIFKYETTEKLYSKIMKSQTSDSELPVVKNWIETLQFANALSERIGLSRCYKIDTDKSEYYVNFNCSGWRLPTEAEWEYATGNESFLYSGSNNIDEVAWYVGNSGEKPHPVGQKKPNGFGLYDMSGNVWEWVYDPYSKSYDENTDKKNPINSAYEITTRVIRGGDFMSPSKDNRVFKRGAGNYIQTTVGFRLLRNCD